MDSSPPGFSVYGILQARRLEWVAISFSRWSSQSRDWTWHLLHLLHWRVDLLLLTHKLGSKRAEEASLRKFLGLRMRKELLGKRRNRNSGSSEAERDMGLWRNWTEVSFSNWVRGRWRMELLEEDRSPILNVDPRGKFCLCLKSNGKLLTFAEGL